MTDHARRFRAIQKALRTGGPGVTRGNLGVPITMGTMPLCSRGATSPRASRDRNAVAGWLLVFIACVVSGALAFTPGDDPADTERTLVVTATAYNSTAAQTDGDPTIAAWGDTLRPGMKAIAVSPDLIPLGLTHGTRVRIEGLSGTYVVRDRMPARWRRKIDIYMGEDVQAARQWGRREVRIRWRVAEEKR